MTHVVSAAARLSRRDAKVLVDPDVGALSDAGLVISMARGRSEALAEAYRRHGPSIYHLTQRRWGQRRAEHVTMEIFLALWRRPEAVNLDQGSLLTHLLAHLGRTDTTAGTTPPGPAAGRVEALRR